MVQISQHSYQDAGVNIAAGDAFVEAIKPLAKRTARPGGMVNLGGFSALIDPKAAGFVDPIFAVTTDGVGTKLKLAIEMNDNSTIGIDLVAMCVNDLIVQGVRPLAFLDYYATGKLDLAQGREIISGISQGCLMAECALVGGETAEMPGLYQEGDYDLAGFAIGAIERAALDRIPQPKAGDRVIGMASSGIHSNGYSLVRRLVAAGRHDLQQPFVARDHGSANNLPRSLGLMLLEPTRIYVKAVMATKTKLSTIAGFAHITGGGLIGNIPRILPAGLGVEIDGSQWRAAPIFDWLHCQGVAIEEMARVFNCGIGMVAIISPEDSQALIKLMIAHDIPAWDIGQVVVTADKSNKPVHSDLSDEARVKITRLEKSWQ